MIDHIQTKSCLGRGFFVDLFYLFAHICCWRGGGEKKGYKFRN